MAHIRGDGKMRRGIRSRRPGNREGGTGPGPDKRPLFPCRLP
ncbi:hypothetical protein ASZ90_002988 [hydrocarbon metagenome]|uniref:Uncharacterized protein n=1 Tax=hydrocarbon metagenome TaxID=938273 RepID=A0A0W8G203_9ZZZZ